MEFEMMNFKLKQNEHNDFIYMIRTAAARARKNQDITLNMAPLDRLLVKDNIAAIKGSIGIIKEYTEYAQGLDLLRQDIQRFYNKLTGVLAIDVVQLGHLQRVLGHYFIYYTAVRKALVDLYMQHNEAIHISELKISAVLKELRLAVPYKLSHKITYEIRTVPWYLLYLEADKWLGMYDALMPKIDISN